MNQQLKELTEFMEAHPEMRFWQSIFTLFGQGYTALGFIKDSPAEHKGFDDTYYE